MKARPFSLLRDYASIRDWCEGHKLPITPANYLARNGFVVETEDRKVCAGFVYQLDSTPMYWIEGIVSNPDTDRETRQSGLVELLKACEEFARSRGAEILLGSSSFPSLTERYRDAGFGDAGRQYAHMGKRLEE
jgi:hypothetical protein